MKEQGIAALGALLLLATGIAHAQVMGDRRWYVGLDVGQSKIDHEPGYRDTDDTSTAYTLLVGYRFSRHFSLEAGYADLGEFSSVLEPACPQPSQCPRLYSTKSLDGFLLNAVGTWPLATHFQVNATIGAIYRDLTVATGINPTGNDSYTYRDGVLKFALGIGVPINSRFDIDLDFTQYQTLGIGYGASYDDAGLVAGSESQVLSLGVRWRF